MAWKLPAPDAFGTYWLSQHQGEKKLRGPAIFASKRLRGTGPATEIVRNGTYIAWTGERFLFAGSDFERFKTPRAALEALHALV